MKPEDLDKLLKAKADDFLKRARPAWEELFLGPETDGETPDTEPVKWEYVTLNFKDPKLP